MNIVERIGGLFAMPTLSGALACLATAGCVLLVDPDRHGAAIDRDAGVPRDGEGTDAFDPTRDASVDAGDLRVDAHDPNDAAIDAAVDGGPPCDGDGDGHLAPHCGGNDCDDANPDRYPGAPPVCGNGEVDDCLMPSVDGALLAALGAQEIGVLPRMVLVGRDVAASLFPPTPEVLSAVVATADRPHGVGVVFHLRAPAARAPQALHGHVVDLRTGAVTDLDDHLGGDLSGGLAIASLGAIDVARGSSGSSSTTIHLVAAGRSSSEDLRDARGLHVRLQVRADGSVGSLSSVLLISETLPSTLHAPTVLRDGDGMPPTYAALATPPEGGDRSLFVWAPGDVPRALGLPMGSSTAAFADVVPTEHIGSWFRFGDVLFDPSAGTGGILRGFPMPSSGHGTQRAANLALLGSSIHFVAPSSEPTRVDLGRMDCPGSGMSETCSEVGTRTTHQLTPDGGAVSAYYPSLEAIGDNVLALTYVTAGFLGDGSPSPSQGIVRFFRGNDHAAIPTSESSPGVTLFSGHDLPTSTIHTSIASASSDATGRVTTLLVSALWSYNSPVADRVWTTGLRICEHR